jgi:hypothetical protein
MIKVTCSCGKNYGFDDETAGRTAKCKNCGATINIPPRETAPPQAQTPSESSREERLQAIRDRRAESDRKKARNKKWGLVILIVVLVAGTTVGLWIVKPWEERPAKKSAKEVDPPKPVVKPIVPPKPVITPPVTTKPVDPVTTRPTTAPAPKIPYLEVFEEKLDLLKNPKLLITKIVANKAGEYLISCSFTDAEGNLLSYTDVDGTEGLHTTKYPVQMEFRKGEKKAVSFLFEKSIPIQENRRYYYKISWGDEIHPPADATTQPKSDN